MKKLYAIKVQANRNLIQLILLTIMLLGASFFSYSQVRVPFTPRSSDYTPGHTVYNIRGDFTMIGNTNLTLVNYGNTTNNSNNDMDFVDVDGDPSTNNSSSSTLTFSEENDAIQSCSNVIYAGLYWTGRSNSNSFTDLRRRTIKFKKAGQPYETLVAEASDIRFPGDDGMFAGYVEVTDQVRNGGLGNYFVADIALSAGDGGTTGYYGGWGMVVVYENSKMDWRDVTVFDGYAYVQGLTNASHTLDVSGFKSVQHGEVDFKLGMMAGEGDVSISGDYFQIRRQSDNQFQSLSHTGNSTTNFFNSSIQTGGNTRNLNRINNTGLDIAMFEVANPNNSIIGNNQTSTQFRYGTTQDTYIIFNITFSVDAYVPDAQGIITTTSVNNNPNPVPLVVLPGDTVEYGMEIRNTGTEATTNTVVTLPIPYTSSYNDLSINWTVNPPLSSPPVPAPYFNPNLGATGSIVWEIGTLPVPNNPDDILATLSFELIATTDCALLVNANCGTNISLGGSISGIGQTSETVFNHNLIQGFNSTGNCIGEPIPTPNIIPINSQQYVIENCGSYTAVRDFYFCNIGTTPIQISEVSAEFPAGTKYYDEYPLTPSSIQYTVSNPFPPVTGTYYAIPPGSTTCYYQFTIHVETISSVPTASDVFYCVDDQAIPLTATTTNPDYILIYYANNDPNTFGQTSITPSTSTAGTFTYYVAEGFDDNCVSPNRTPILVTVYEQLTITLENIIPLTCNSDDIGAIDISVSGGSGTYSYLWNDTAGSTTQDISDLPAGSYTVTVNDDNSSCTATATYEIAPEDNTVPTLTAPDGFSTEGCTSTDVTNGDFTALSYSETAVTITETEFLAEGGIFEEDTLASITYQDSSTGTCPIIVNRVYTITDDCGASATDTQIITINTLAVIVNAPANFSATACNYENQAQLDTAFNIWLEEFNVSGGCNATADYGSPTAPILCEGGTTTVTYTITDACNPSSIERTFTITAPEALTIITEASNISIPCDGTGDNTAIDAWLANNGNAVVSDSCSEVTWTNNYGGITTDCSDPVLVTFTATDACGNSVNTSATYSIIDTVAPIITAAISETVECDGAGNIVALNAWLANNGGATATDDCSSISWSNNFTSLSDDCGETGTASVTFTATDGCGNDASTTASFTIIDTIAPVAPDAPADITYECVDDVPAPGELTAIDNCAGNITVTGVDTTNDTDPCNVSIIRTWTFDDACNNVSSVSQTITVSDTTPPTFDGTNNPVCVSELINGSFEANTFNGTHVQFPQDQVPGWSTTSPHGTLELQRNGQIDGSVPHSGNYHYELNGRGLDNLYQEFCSLPSSQLEITFFHKKRPGSSTVDVLELYAGNDLNNLTLLGTFQVNINEGWKENIVNYTVPSNHNSTIIFFKAISGSTNSVGNLLDDISVRSNNNSYGPMPADITVECTAIPEIPNITASDNCGQATVVFTESQNPGSCANEYTIVRTWTASDPCGNSISHTQNITVQDTTAPGFVQSPPEDIIVECDAIPEAPVLTATDNCGEATVTFAESSTTGTCPTSEIIERVWTATDACGNETIITQLITVVDTIAPEVPEAPADITYECISEVPDAGDLTATDACSGDITATATETTDSTDPCNVIITRTWTFTDTCNNSASVTQIITVADTIAPIAPEAPADITYECMDDVPTAGDLVAIDNCAGEITATGVDVVDNTDPCNLTIVRTWTFNDGCNNAVSVSQTITVSDTTPPEFSGVNNPVCVAEIINGTFEANTFNGEHIQFPQEEVPGWSTTAAHGTLEIQRNGQVNGSIPHSGNYHFELNGRNLDDLYQEFCTLPSSELEITFYHKKRPGSSTVDVLELYAGNDLNNLTLLGTFQVSAEEDWKENIVNYTVPSNHNSTIILFQAVSGSSNSVGNLLDDISVRSNNNSYGPLPTDITVECTDIPEIQDLTATDNCGEATVTFTETQTPGACDNEYTLIRTWTASDTCGNSISHTQNITVQDTTAPGFVQTPPQNITVECDAIPNAPQLTATDNCGDATVTFTESSIAGSCPTLEFIERTWTATDACGNETIITQIITVVDTVAPIVPEAPSDITLECISSDIPAAVELTATDNCSGDIVGVVSESTDNSNPCNLIITRTWTFTDTCNNSSSVSQTITVTDTIAPAAPAAPADITYECISDVPVAGDLTATDNCAGDITVTGVDTTDNSNPCNVIITRTWTFTDACDNSSSVSQTISVIDTTIPVVTNNLSDITVNCDVIPDAPTLEFDDCSSNVTITYFNEDNSYDGTDNNYEIIWTWEFADACGNIGTASQIVYVTMTDTIVLENDSRCNDDGTIDLFDYYNGSNTSGTWIVVSGNATLDGSYFDPSNVELGDYVFSYTVPENGCLSTTEVTININGDCIVLPCTVQDVVISKAITPNGDQWNEYFEVTGIETCGFVIDVKIFNRWGAMIYESDSYQNNWSGTASKASIGNSNTVPAGTYYYILNLKNSGFKPFTGYVYIGTK